MEISFEDHVKITDWKQLDGKELIIGVGEKTFEGNKDHRDPKDFSLDSLKSIPGLKVKVTFFDGEVMYGSTNGYTPERKGFFIFPVDKESNNDRVFAIRQSAVTVETWR